MFPSLVYLLGCDDANRNIDGLTPLSIITLNHYNFVVEQPVVKLIFLLEFILFIFVAG